MVRVGQTGGINVGPLGLGRKCAVGGGGVAGVECGRSGIAVDTRGIGVEGTLENDGAICILGAGQRGRPNSLTA